MSGRGKAAFRAMKALGISDNKVKPVLKDLLKLFDKNWAYIEDDNYRALIDAIFEREETDAIECSKRKAVSEEVGQSKRIAMDDFPIQKEGCFEENEAEANEEPEIPLKRLRLKHRIDQGSSSNEPAEATEEPERPLKRLRLKHRDGQGTSEPGTGVPKLALITPKEEPSELPETRLLNLSDDRRLKRNADSEAALHLKTIANGEKVGHLEENESEEAEEPEVPLKRRPRLKHRDEPSSVPKIALITPKEEPNELSETCLPNPSDGRRSKRNADSERVHRLEENESEETEEPERPLKKRLRLKHLDDQGYSFNKSGSSVPKIPLVTPKEEPNELSETQLVNEGNQSFPPQATPSREKSVVPESSSHDALNKEPTVEPSVVLTPEWKGVVGHALIEPNDEPATDDVALFAVPIAVIHADPSNAGNLLSNGCTTGEHEPSVSLSVNENEPRNEGGLEKITGQSPNLEIASLPFGDGKISLSCELEFGRPGFRMPDRETVLRLVEKKCLRSYKVLDPDFSVMNLMKDMCHGFLKSASDSSSEPPAAINVTTNTDLLITQEMNHGDDHPEMNVENEKNSVEEMNASWVVLKQPDGVIDIANVQENAVITVVSEVSDDVHPEMNVENENDSVEEMNTSLVVLQQPDGVIDIANIQENAVITVVNDVNDDGHPEMNVENENDSVEEMNPSLVVLQQPDGVIDIANIQENAVITVVSEVSDDGHPEMNVENENDSVEEINPSLVVLQQTDGVIDIANIQENAVITVVNDVNDDVHPEMNVENEKNSVEDMNPSLVVLKQPSGVIDIANGQEIAVITMVNEVNDDGHPEMNVENEKNSVEEMNPSLVVLKQPDGVIDIANGQENAVITVVNEVNDDGVPHFYYMSKNAVFQNAVVKFSLANIGQKSCCSTCSGDCLSLSKPCACARESGCEFAYTPDGLVKEGFLEECISMTRDPKEHGQLFCKECPHERSKGGDSVKPCKGHVMRKFIKECWWKCGCDLHCGNRVVQRGISSDLQVFMTPEGKGWGLRTLVDLPKGAFVCEYVGEILTSAELSDRVTRSPKGEKTSYPVVLDAGWGAKGKLKDGEALCLDAAYYGNVGRFINHRCHDSNLVEIPVEVETPDHHYYHLALFTTRAVSAMEELTWDYSVDFDDQDQLVKAFRCQCGSKFCRNI